MIEELQQTRRLRRRAAAASAAGEPTGALEREISGSIQPRLSISKVRMTDRATRELEDLCFPWPALKHGTKYVWNTKYSTTYTSIQTQPSVLLLIIKSTLYMYKYKVHTWRVASPRACQAAAAAAGACVVSAVRLCYVVEVLACGKTRVRVFARNAPTEFPFAAAAVHATLRLDVVVSIHTASWGSYAMDLNRTATSMKSYKCAQGIYQ